MGRIMSQRADRPARDAAPAARRVVLVASGGVMLALATAVGWKGSGHGGGPASRPAAAAPQTSYPPGPSAAPARSAAARESARITPARSAPRASAHPAPASARDPGPGRGGTAVTAPVYYLDDGPMTLALTIDDGPSPVYTPQILQILDRYQITASFSMVGENVGYYPGVARDVAAAGHVIVNHTWDHADLSRMTTTRARTEIARASDAIESAVGAPPTAFRAPYGAWSRAVLEYCAREHLMPLDWSVDPRDWARPGTRAIIRNILANARTGSIILEHDGGGDRSQTVAALKVVIPRLLDEGYRFRPAGRA
jgi:peptidoglycan/xylan/chitin deacetylase (PgdA/CDA1 family)